MFFAFVSPCNYLLDVHVKILSLAYSSHVSELIYFLFVPKH